MQSSHNLGANDITFALILGRKDVNMNLWKIKIDSLFENLKTQKFKKMITTV
jgi:hypothetical protein